MSDVTEQFIEVSLCADIQCGTESNLSRFSSEAKSSDSITENRLTMLHAHYPKGGLATDSLQCISQTKLSSVNPLHNHQIKTDNNWQQDVSQTQFYSSQPINVQLHHMPATEGALQTADYSKQMPEVLADSSQKVGGFVSTSHTGRVDGNTKTNAFSTDEILNGKGLSDCGDIVSYPKTLKLAEYKDGKTLKSSTLPEHIDDSPLKVEFNMHHVHKGQEKQHVESISDLYTVKNSDFQMNEVPSDQSSLQMLRHGLEPLKATTDASANAPNVESSLQNLNKETDSNNRNAGYEPLEDTIALWVKWRGKWQIGIYCPKEDCPLQTLRAKPTHERKKYLSIFFPHTRTYGWTDRQLVCSIKEMPEPLAPGARQSWLEIAKDLTVPRRFVMQKLAVAMLDLSDKLHTEAVTQSARVALFWKEFAKEASCCKSYSELGKMLLKLQEMILPRYVNPDWLNQSLSSWKQMCQCAGSAESVEILTKELANSIIWKDVEELWNAPVQPELGSEWKTWKQEAMQLFTVSFPMRVGDQEQQGSDNSASIDSQRSSKRPKLAIDQQNIHDEEAESPEALVRYKDVETINPSDMHAKSLSSACNPDDLPVMGIDVQAVLPNRTGHCNEIVARDAHIENGGSNVQILAVAGAPRNKYKRCLAFMEARQKQCGRWASDGHDYCCAHAGSSIKNYVVEHPSKSTMCMGTTTHGNKCKHRARDGSSFCKKHHYFRSDILERDDVVKSRENGDNNLLKNVPDLDGECNNETLSVEDVQIAFEGLVRVTVGETLEEGNCLMNRHEIYGALPAPMTVCSVDTTQCIGSNSKYHNVNDQCGDNATRYSLYCEKHIPRFLKCAKGGGTRFISREIFVGILRCCRSRKQKLFLHRACEVLYNYMRRTFSSGIDSKGDLLNWVLSEASKDPNVGEYLLKLVSSERQKIGSLWGFESNDIILPTSLQSKSVPEIVAGEGFSQNAIMSLKCKTCEEQFHDEQELGVHWIQIHKKEAKQHFRGYACAICMDSFTGKKLLESHINDRHGVQFLQHSVLFRCMSCNSHFPSPVKFWEHVLSFHSVDFRLPTQRLPDQLQLQSTKVEVLNKLYAADDTRKDGSGGTQSFLCMLCSMKFHHQTDLDCHHRAVHMDRASTSCFTVKNSKRNHLITNKNHRPRHKLTLRPTFQSKSSANHSMKRHFQASSSVIAARLKRQNQASEIMGLGRLVEPHCSSIAERLFAEIRQTKPQPSTSEIISIAQSACCSTYIHNILEKQYRSLSENLYLRAARLCSEQNIPIGWHLEGFTCPRGCHPHRNPHNLAPLVPLSNDFRGSSAPPMDLVDKVGKEMDGCHYIVSPRHYSRHNFSILCKDISFGKESVPVACVIDDCVRHLFEANADESSYQQNITKSMPWHGFSYITNRLLDSSISLELDDSSLYLDSRSSQLGCACIQKCYPGECDHVYLFNDDYENAEDVNGSSMNGRFPYDETGRIRLKEGYPVYECNATCKCDRSCQNRVLQNGMQVKLEIFRTEKKGWAVRSLEAISRGTFVCEYVGEVKNSTEADDSSRSYEDGSCRFLFDISALANDLWQLGEAQSHFVIDATKFGNISRFINHSCSPNLVCYLVLVESMECQLAHIGLFASKDIAAGEELVFNYRFNSLHGDRCPCYCESSNCRGYL